MMRPIEFRGWHREEKAILQVGDDYGTTHPLDCCVYAMEGQPVELQQYTGVNTLDNFKIFEGDIIGWSDVYLGQGVHILANRGVVRFADAAFFVEPLDGGDTDFAPDLDAYDMNRFNVKIVGEEHTYENGKYVQKQMEEN